ncbi:hypothetical protein JDV02_005313 [Purpureocillium takamizusanense]|uniref:Uncharacterized protein n=1 Tax=Purpureocillium takamizusanense TaxID=2060973 RepID=A0A9Q8VBS3_9HYPO|nr:uncharacterized protein JDV02_005313 [Purpureocillium takamizusanense]UNI19097.1 hypothetical protein JDV02_005313 [Purpureocillium takamizusanense]
MDDPSRRRRQNEAPARHTSNLRYPHQDPITHSSAIAGGTSERFRPAPLATDPSTPRSMGVANNYSSYYQESQTAFSTPNMSTTAMSYGQDYGPDSRGQNQGFGSYSAGMMMYNVAQPSTPVYDTQQFAQRQQAAMQMMTSDVASTYFGSSDAGSAPSSSLQQASGHGSSSSGLYQQSNAPVGYGGGISNVTAMQQPAAGVGASENHEYHDTGLEEKWMNYQRQLGTVFQDVKAGSLESAAETLLSLSNWLLTQVADLGLSQDDANLHEERIKLWNDFNHAWLALAFQQKTMMESGQPPGRGQKLMSEDTVKKMGDELIRLCDGIERHGLVDYQYGVWEDQIESALEECLDLFESMVNEGRRP